MMRKRGRKDAEEWDRGEGEGEGKRGISVVGRKVAQVR